MAVKLRLQRKGRKKSPFYHIVVADGRAPRDGRFIEKVGTYNPLTIPATIELNHDRAYDWLMKGAQPTDTVNAILRFKGVLLRKHLALGVAKGALTQEQADAKLADWMGNKESRIAARREENSEKKRKAIVAMDGKAKVKVKPVVEEPAAPEAAEEAAPVVEEAAAVVEAPVVEAVAEVAEETPVAEAPAEVVEAVAEVVEAPVEEPAVAVEPEEAPVAEAETPAAEEKSEDA